MAAHDRLEARGAAIDAARWALGAGRWALDLQLRYRPRTEVDLQRFDLWAAQILVYAARNHQEGVVSDVFALDYIRDNIQASLSTADLKRLNEELGSLQALVVDGELSAEARHARALRTIAASIAEQ